MSGPQTISNPMSAYGEVEALLLEHPDVIDASLVNEEGLDGHTYPVAYVVPHAGRMKEARARIYRTDRDKRVAQWRKAFNQTYRSGPANHAPTFVGWTSSYTNEPMPQTEMQEWLDCTIQRIMSLGPNKVLEIGCGVGLLLQELAPKCSVYRGADFSPIAVARLREFAASKPELRHVELFECEATDLDEQELVSVDTVVINSVIQYFPDIHYLRTVLERATQVVGSGGRIFIGDVRHVGLLRVFHGAVQIAKAPPKASARWLKRKVALAIEQDRELVIDPQFFLELRDSIPRICGVEILLKRGQAHNELTRYRYDAVLHVSDADSARSRPGAEYEARDLTIAELVSRFDAQQLAAVNILNVPNRRLASDLERVRRLWSADDRVLVEDIRRPMVEQTETGCDPEDFWKLSDVPGRDVRVGWSAQSTQGHFDVALVDRDRAPDARLHQRPTNVLSASHGGRLATDPLAVAFMQKLGLELGQLLSDRLPESRRPAAVLAVNELPSGAAVIRPGPAAHFRQDSDGRTDSRQMVQG